METLSATFQIVTPMFLGQGQNNNQRIETAQAMRPPSIKGALRFWWRAMNWGGCLKAEKGNSVQALKELCRRESILFGAAADDDETHGQSKFLLTISDLDKSHLTSNAKMGLGHKYLLGQGLSREPLDLGAFRVKLIFRRNVSPEEYSGITEAILIWGLLGGLGSRSRKGFGSVAIQSLQSGTPLNPDTLKIPQNEEELVDILKSLLTGLPPDLPPFTAFSQKTRIDISLRGQEAWSLLGRAGDEMQFYRSNGQHGLVRGNPAETTFLSDHDLAQAAAAGTSVTTHPRRVVFGLPHNYQFTGTGHKLKITGDGEKRDRRASPLLIHAHRFPTGACAIIQSSLPAVFLPRGDRLVMKGQGTQRVTTHVDWSVIDDYLDRFIAKHKGTKVIG